MNIYQTGLGFTDANISAKTKTKTNKQFIISNNFNTEYGYSIDKDGFMGEDFNRAAHIPQNIKIHINTLKQIDTYSKNSKQHLSPIVAFEKAWNFFNKISDNISSRFDKVKINDLQNLPSAYKSNGTIFDENVHVYHGLNERFEPNKLENELLFVSNGKLSTGFESLFTLGFGLKSKGDEQSDMEFMGYLQKSFDEITKTQSKKDDTITPSELFAIFIDKQTSANPNSKKANVDAFNEIQNHGGIREYLNKSFGNDYMQKIKQKYAENMTDKIKSYALLEKMLDEIDSLKNMHTNSLKFPSKKMFFNNKELI